MKAAALCCFAAALLSTPVAWAFCRTTTCNPSDPKQACELADNGLCVTSGTPLAWRSSCVTVAVQQMGSPTNGFSYDDVAKVVEQGFAPWLGASCAGGKPPSIDVKLIGPVECGESEYNKTAGNANIVLFRDGPWREMGAQNALALTTTRFDTTNGDLWDADIELNGADSNFSIGDPITGDDLLSVLTHESGHFLGLSHSTDDTATMRPIYNPQRDGSSFRSLADDDVAGICAIYPPDRKPATTSCENRHGFSAECGDAQTPANESKGCSVSAPAAEREPKPLALLALLAACGVRVARRRRIV